ncbi:Hypothetical predicted protein [Mytilus galloprovincialis]|uniref:C-type lectin domain-containing protein n=1 Tax=Mytilus galloprovincialis TaxID=29158 RepID=A0A8B6FJR8_MYTGA|nr:Hypothetical predicted protein [Mytilus galloprovincialis]
MILAYLLALTCICAVHSECPFGWVVGNTSCYLFHHEKLSWTVASHYCRSVGGHLATVESKQEKDEIHEFSKFHSAGDFWLDGIDDVHESDWRWASTYSIINPTFWHPGQPDNLKGNEDCLEVRIGDNGQWNDDDCAKHQFCLCEKSLN